MRLLCLASLLLSLIALSACDDPQTSNPAPANNPKPANNTPSKMSNTPADPPAVVVKMTQLTGADADAAAKGELRAGSVYIDIIEKQITLDGQPTNAERLAGDLKKLVLDKTLTKITVRMGKGVKSSYLQMVRASAGDAGLKEIESLYFDPAAKTVIEPPK